MHESRAATSPVRALAAALLALAGAAVFLHAVGRHVPLGKWLFFSYARAIGAACVFALGSLSAGTRLARRLAPSAVGPAARLTYAAPLGVLAFFAGQWALGALGLLGPASALGLPLALFAWGAPVALPWTRRLWRHVARRRSLGTTPHSPLALAATLLGVLGLAIVWTGVLVPENASYDARWYHLPIAEHYAAEGAIRPTVEGWYQSALPHLASVLYVFAYTWPKLTLFERVEVAAHQELALFVLTLVAVGHATGRLVGGGRRPRGAWAAIFLFPGIFVYDASLGLGADHVAALFAIPLALATFDALPRLEPRRLALVGALAGGALATKYQSAMLVVVPAAALAGRVAHVAVRGDAAARRRALVAASAGLATFAAITAPHWLKNAVFHGDPLYPLLHDRLRDRPFVADAPRLLDEVFLRQLWRPSGSLVDKTLATLRALVTFAFEPHDWESFHRDVPVFGALFTLTLPLVVLAPPRARRRIGALALASLGAIAAWYLGSHQDRYLQIALPWLAATTAATLVATFHAHRAARAPLALLVGAQLVWGADQPFLPAHTQLHASPIASAAQLFSSSFRGDFEARGRIFGDMGDVGRALPKGAKVLVHQVQEHAGLLAASVNDWGGWQGGLRWAATPTPRAAWEATRAMGVTHVVWRTHRPRDWDSLAGDLVFFDLATNDLCDVRTFGELSLGSLGTEPPPATRDRESALVLGCGDGYATGVYALADLDVPAFRAPPAAEWPRPRRPLGDALGDEIARAAFVVKDAACRDSLESALGRDFEHVGSRRSLELWVRRRAGACRR